MNQTLRVSIDVAEPHMAKKKDKASHGRSQIGPQEPPARLATSAPIPSPTIASKSLSFSFARSAKTAKSATKSQAT